MPSSMPMSAEPPQRPIPPLPPLNALTLVRALFKRRRRTPGARTPRTGFRLDTIDPAWLRRYRQALGFRDEGVPLTFYYLLAQRAQVATMLAPGFPFRLAGTVHAGNSLRLHAPLQPRLPLMLATAVAVAPPDERGAVYATLETTGSQDGGTVFTCRSSYLVVRGERRAPGGARPPARDAAAAAPLAEWQLGAGSGRAYARVSGDWNPIHLWTWSARLMGMRRPIIHGMHTLARVCAALEDAGGRPVAAIDARFRAPAALGSTLVLAADLGSGAFAVRCGERTVADGRFELG
jgi:acyl dehydratase